jgi:hypothetical protein
MKSIVIVVSLVLVGCASTAPVTMSSGDGGGGGSATTVTTDTTATTTSPPAPVRLKHGSACLSTDSCGFPYSVSTCAEVHGEYLQDEHCPSAGLVGCCGDAAAHGGAWVCYYDGDRPVECADWQTVVP